ncbi:MAG: leucine-rich repeat protein [Ruminococcus sp.]|nr:leucine-rich repeat protein [Ruminococcus sp.]
MKRLFSILLAVMIASMCSLSTFAADIGSVKCGKTTISLGDWVYEAIDGGAHWELDEYLGESKNIIAPRIVNDKMVVTLGSYCFYNNKTVKKVSTSSPLWTVDEYAFLKCTSLEEFECNFALKKINIGAFMGASSLKKINLEDSAVETISPHAFTDSGIVSIKLPDTCVEIMHDGFSQCQNLEEIFIPDSVTEIGDNAFAYCDNLKIYCNTNSAAHVYAINNNIPYRLLDNPMLGDSNADGEVDIMDAAYIQRYKIGDFGMNEYQKKCADVTHDGKVTVRDATLIQMKLAGYDVDF